MPKVKIVEGPVGYNGIHQTGAVLNVDAVVADRWAELGVAVVLDSAPAPVAPTVVDAAVDDIEATIQEILEADQEPEDEPEADDTDVDALVDEVLKVNVNTATKPELEAVTGIGPKAADGIIALRPITTLESLRTIPRVGWDKVLPLLTL